MLRLLVLLRCRSQGLSQLKVVNIILTSSMVLMGEKPKNSMAVTNIITSTMNSMDKERNRASWIWAIGRKCHSSHLVIFPLTFKDGRRRIEFLSSLLRSFIHLNRFPCNGIFLLLQRPLWLPIIFVFCATPSVGEGDFFSTS